MYFYLFLSFSIYTLSYLLLGLYVYLNYAICFRLIYDICGSSVMGLVFYDFFVNDKCFIYALDILTWLPFTKVGFTKWKLYLS